MDRVVVFDVGGVLLDWNPRYLYCKLLPDEAAIDAFFAEVDFAGWNVGQDAGRSWSDGVAELGGRFPHHAALIEAADTRWHEMVVGLIAGTVAILEVLKSSGVPLYAITNFSSEKWMEAQTLFPVLTVFRDVVVSGDEKILKPDAAIYQRLLGRNGLEARNCIFIDDSEATVAGAMAAGMDGIQFHSPHALREALIDRGFGI